MAKKLATGGGGDDEGGNSGLLLSAMCIMRDRSVWGRGNLWSMQNATLASFGYFSSFIFFFAGSVAGAVFHSLSVKTMDAASVDSYFDLCEFVFMCVCECVCGKCVPGSIGKWQ